MTYRFQDILRMVIPGLYLIALCFILFAWIGWIDISDNSTILSLLKSTFANALALLLPFVGFVIGYLINVMSCYIERKMFTHDLIPRPSAHVLNGDIDYHIEQDQIDQLKESFGLQGFTKIDNEQANKAFQSAKEALRKDENITVFLAQSILARNLAGCQILFTFICLIGLYANLKLSLLWTVASLLLCVVMVYNWWRQRCVYAKYVFAAYNTLEDNSSASAKKLLDK